MKKTLFLLASIALALHGFAVAATVKTAFGELRGKSAGGVDAFLGIPYATPPVGNNRWKSPQPAAHWSGVREADKFATSCAQELFPGGIPPYTPEYNVQDNVGEDCLYLNVWAPTAHSSRPFPVLVWIHGGGFGSGSGAVPIYDGAQLSARGVLVVTINYRLGVLGFLAHPDLTREAGSSGNYALQDMIASLQWVQRNIAAFGGDPANVTIAGQSAGAMAVHDLVAAPAAKGLFVKAIAQSGSGVGPRLANRTTAEAQGEQYMKKAGVSTIAELRKLPVDRLQELTGFKAMIAGGPPAMMFGPSVDGVVLPRPPGELRRGEFNDTPFLTGLNGDEGASASTYGKSTVTAFKEMLATTFGTRAARALALYDPTTDTDAGAMAKQFARERGIASALLWADQRIQESRFPVYLYLFRHAPPGADSGRWGAFHTAEVPYVLQTLDKSPDRRFTSVDRELSRTMGSYWVNFMRTGNPNAEGLSQWPALDPRKPELMEFGEGASSKPALDAEKLELFRDFQKSGGQFSFF